MLINNYSSLLTLKNIAQQFTHLYKQYYRKPRQRCKATPAMQCHRKPKEGD